MMGVTSASSECDASRIFFGVSRTGFTKGRVAKEPEGVETQNEEDDVVGRADAGGPVHIDWIAQKPACGLGKIPQGRTQIHRFRQHHRGRRGQLGGCLFRSLFSRSWSLLGNSR